jgi:hypothetical protein
VKIFRFTQMPRTPDASTVTTFRRVNATIPEDPTVKSRAFVAPLKDGYQIAVLRSTQEVKSIVNSQSVLAIPEWKSPRFNGRFFVN